MQPGADPCLRFIVAHLEDATYRLDLGPNAPPCDEGAHRVLHRNEGNGPMGRRRPNTGTGSAWFRIHSGLGGDALGATMSPRSNSARCRNRPSSAATAVASSTSTLANMRGSTIASGRNGWFK